MIRYLDMNSLYPYVMSNTDFPVEHPVIRHSDFSCRNLLKDIERSGDTFIGLCLVRVFAPKNLMVPYLPHKVDGKLMFLWCQSCSIDGMVQ